MGREYGKVMQSIWGDPDWRKLSSAAQRAYLLALTQPGLSYCGVVPFTARRWATLASDTNEKKIRSSVAELAVAKFVVVDEDTEEMLLRTFVKWDGVMDQPNLVKAMKKAYRVVLSSTVRGHFLLVVHELAEEYARSESKPTGWSEAEELLIEAFPEGFREGLPEGFTDDYS